MPAKYVLSSEEKSSHFPRRNDANNCSFVDQAMNFDDPTFFQFVPYARFPCSSPRNPEGFRSSLETLATTSHRACNPSLGVRTQVAPPLVHASNLVLLLRCRHRPFRCEPRVRPVLLGRSALRIWLSYPAWRVLSILRWKVGVSRLGQSGVSVCWLGLEGGFERVLAVAVGSMMRERSLAASASLSHFLSQLTAFVGGCIFSCSHEIFSC